MTYKRLNLDQYAKMGMGKGKNLSSDHSVSTLYTQMLPCVEKPIPSVSTCRSS